MLTVIFATCFVTASVIRRGIKLSMVDGEKGDKECSELCLSVIPSTCLPALSPCL